MSWRQGVGKCEPSEQTLALMDKKNADVRNAIVEECAKVCDKLAEEAENRIERNPSSNSSQIFATISNASNDCAAMIRDLKSAPSLCSSHNSGERVPSSDAARGGADTTQHCPICGWPMASSREKGCVPGDCSYRPDDPAEQRRISERRKALAHTRPHQNGEA